MRKELNLKKFSEDQIDLLFKWVNDPECRRNSFQSESIPYETHEKWCFNNLNSNNVDIYIAYMDNIPVGQLRLIYEENRVIISYSIDPNFRGMGFGKQLLLLIEEYQLYKKHYIRELVGKVKKDNIASQKLFEYCQYTKNIREDYLEYIKEII